MTNPNTEHPLAYRQEAWEDKIVPFLRAVDESGVVSSPTYIKSNTTTDMRGNFCAKFNLGPVMVRKAYLDYPSIWADGKYQVITDPYDPRARSARYRMEVWATKAVADRLRKGFVRPFYHDIVDDWAGEEGRGAKEMAYADKVFKHPVFGNTDPEVDLSYPKDNPNAFSVIRFKGRPLASPKFSPNGPSFHRYSITERRGQNTHLVDQEEIMPGDIISLKGYAKQFSGSAIDEHTLPRGMQNFGISFFMDTGRSPMQRLIRSISQEMWTPPSKSDEAADEFLDSLNSEADALRANNNF